VYRVMAVEHKLYCELSPVKLDLHTYQELSLFNGWKTRFVKYAR